MTIGLNLKTTLMAFDLGQRYAFGRHSATSFISRIAVAGLALSVAVLVIVLSVINGFEKELKERVFGILPHASLHGYSPFVATEDEVAKLTATPAIIGAAPFVQGPGVAVNGDEVQGILLMGVEPGQHRRVSNLERFLIGGDLAELQPGGFGVVLGARLALGLGVGVGDSITLVLPEGSLTPFGLLPRQKRFQVIALLRSGSELDGRAAYIHLADAQRFLKLDANIHGYQLKVLDLDLADFAVRAGMDSLSPGRFYARTWRHSHGNLHQAIATQKASMFVLLAFLVVVAAFNLISALVMTVEQRKADIAILKTMGAKTGILVGSFVVLGALIGSMGVLIGILCGCLMASALPALFAWINTSLNLDLMNQYFISYLPVDIWLGDVARIAAVAFGLCVVCTVYPAWCAARLLPSQVLAHE